MKTWKYSVYKNEVQMGNKNIYIQEDILAKYEYCVQNLKQYWKPRNHKKREMRSRKLN